MAFVNIMVSQSKSRSRRVYGNSRDYIQISLVDNSIQEKSLTEKHGSDKGKLVPTDIGMIVTDFLVEHFGNILDYNFTGVFLIPYKIQNNYSKYKSN